MNVEFINPFLNATINVISTMAFCEIKAGAPIIRKTNTTSGVVTGFIGLAGPNVIGSVIISFTKESILEIVSKMLGEEFTEITPDVEDAVGEITNMIVGGAKRILSSKGFKFDMAIPTIIKGENVSINLKTRGARIVIPFNLGNGSFFEVEACIEEY